METGKPLTFESGPNSEKKFIEIGHVAPCKTGWECPKGSPDQEADFRLSDRNHRVVRLYHQCRVVGGGVIKPVDPLLAELLSICDQVYNGWHREEDRRKTNSLMVALEKSRVKQ